MRESDLTGIGGITQDNLLNVMPECLSADTKQKLLDAWNKLKTEPSKDNYRSQAQQERDQLGLNCKLCNNTGDIVVEIEGSRKYRKCECDVEYRRLRRRKYSCFTANMLDKYTFDKYKCETDWQTKIFKLAHDFIKHIKVSPWFYVSGQTGSGKTHIGVAVSSTLIDLGYSVKCLKWREVSIKLKQLICDYDRYQDEIKKYKECDILFIDDLLKRGGTEADITVAFDLIDSRYDANKITIITSEHNMDDLRSLDEALANRITEMTEKIEGFAFTLNVGKDPEKDMRLRLVYGDLQ